jgi:hypothetical protein
VMNMHDLGFMDSTLRDAGTRSANHVNGVARQGVAADVSTWYSLRIYVC